MSHYWSSSPDGSNAIYAYRLLFGSGDLILTCNTPREFGFPVSSADKFAPEEGGEVIKDGVSH